jgi:hypothetical protein
MEKERMAGIIKPQNPSFREFYDTKLFSGIKMHIGKPAETYRVVSLGIFPRVASYNGFFCLDCYQNYYSLKYKHSFRDIIAKETYIISAVEIVNYESMGLALENVFEGDYWRIHLYRVQ